MTRKDYQLIAEAIREARSISPGAVVVAPSTRYHDDGVDTAARYLASALERDNPRFDRARFLKACGVEE